MSWEKYFDEVKAKVKIFWGKKAKIFWGQNILQSKLQLLYAKAQHFNFLSKKHKLSIYSVIFFVKISATRKFV